MIETRNQFCRLRIGMGVGLVLAAVAVAGCSSTAQGLREDTARDRAAAAAEEAHAAAATRTAATHVKRATVAVATNLSDATTLTPLVKASIISDPVLRDRRNTINVQTVGHVVHLRGQVFKATMKTRAEEDAQKVIEDRHSPDTVQDDLSVAGS